MRAAAWLGAFTQVNNTAVGLWYIGAALLFLVLGGILALMMRTQLAVPSNDLVDHDLYNQLSTVTMATVSIAAAINIRLLQPGRRCYSQSPLDEHSRFIGFVALAAGAIGLVALILLAWPAILVKACAQP